MKPIDRPLLRGAVALQVHLKADPCGKQQVVLPIDDWNACQTLVGKLERCRAGGWQLAARRLEEELREGVSELASRLQAVKDSLMAADLERPRPAIVDIYRDLMALDDEFSDVYCDLTQQIVCATTEPIVLEGVHLGAFEIMLDWGRTPGQVREYRVLAQDPNPPAKDASVTHPHVQDDMLCEGAGHGAIRRALNESRLLDFFQLVAGVLRTYNADSPYVTLDEWYGVECGECAATIPADDYWVCEQCGTKLCENCYMACLGCSEVFCVCCANECAACEAYLCPPCTKRCQHCDKTFCNLCLSKEQFCVACHEKAKNEQAAEEEESASHDPTDAPLQPDSLGQAADSA